MDSHQEYHKRKKRKETFKKIIVNIVVWGVVLAFVMTIGVYMGEQKPTDYKRLVKVGKMMFDDRPGSEYNTYVSVFSDQVREQYKASISSSIMRKFIINQSLKMLEYDAVIYDFAQKNGVEVSKQYLQSIFSRGRNTAVPSQQIINYHKMFRVRQGFVGQMGDLNNMVSFINMSEIYSYFDIINYVVTSEILYLNITNFVAAKLNFDDAKSYYSDNIYRYANEIYIQDITVNKKRLAHEITEYAKTNNWDKALAKYKTQYTITGDITINSEKNVSRRYEVAMQMLTNTNADFMDKVTPKPVFENGEYHIFKIVGLPTYETLDKTAKKSILAEYAEVNYPTLEAKYKPLADEAVKKAGIMAKSGTSFKQIASITGMTYIKSGKISPVNRLLRDSVGEVVNIPLMKNNKWLDFLFTAKITSVSSVFNNDGYAVILKVLNRGVNPDMDYENIDDEIQMRYARFKNDAVVEDWYDSIREKAEVTTYTNEIALLYK